MAAQERIHQIELPEQALFKTSSSSARNREGDELFKPALILFGIFALLSVWLLPWLQVKPNRLIDGVAQSLSALNHLQSLILTGLYAVVLWLALRSRQQPELWLWRRIAAAVALMSLVLSLAFTGIDASILAGEDLVIRLTPSIGFLTVLAASYGLWKLIIDEDAYWSRMTGLIALVVIAGLLFTGCFDTLSIMREYQNQVEVFWREFAQHLYLAGVVVLLGGVLGCLIGALAAAHQAFRSVVFFLLNIVQTVPSLALFGLMILPLAALSEHFPLLREWGIGGIGPAPAIIALTLYALFPVARSTLTAIESLPADILAVGRGMGMGKGALLWRVKLPLVIPAVAQGLRLASVQTVGNTVIAALIGAGGLGAFIFQGLGQFAIDLILLGTLPVVMMALALDGLWGVVIQAITPRTMREVRHG